MNSRTTSNSVTRSSLSKLSPKLSSKNLASTRLVFFPKLEKRLTSAILALKAAVLMPHCDLLSIFTTVKKIMTNSSTVNMKKRT